MTTLPDWVAVQAGIQAWVVTGSGLATGQVIWSEQQGPRPVGTYVELRLDGITPVGQDWTTKEELPLAFSPLTVASVDTVGNAVRIVAHGLATGDGPVRDTTTGVLPGGLALLTDYWAIVDDVDHLGFATTHQNAINHVRVDLTSSGSGVHTVTATASTRRSGAEILRRVRGQRTATLKLRCFVGTPTGVAMPIAILNAVLTAASLPSVRDALNAAGVALGTTNPVRSVDGIKGALFEPRAMTELELHLASEVTETTTYIETFDLTSSVAP